MKRLFCMLLVLSSLFAFSQKVMKVVSFKPSSSDISARTNQREDTNGDACALIKVQLPLPNAYFEGNIIGRATHKTNEYWVYMPQNTTNLTVKLAGYSSLSVFFKDYDIPKLESKTTYELCILPREHKAPQLYDEGMIALAENDIISAYDKLEKAAESGYGQANYILGSIQVHPYEVPGYRWNHQDPNTSDAYQAAFDYYKKAADAGVPEGIFALGEFLKQYIDTKDKINKYPMDAKMAPNIYKIIVPEELCDSATIWELIKKAADLGCLDAQWMMFSDEEWCKENASKGVAIAEFAMGVRADQELSIDEYPMLNKLVINHAEDYKTAFDWYQKAANHGLDFAQWRLGEMYARGLGVDADIENAIDWRTKAAEQGNSIFQYIMGLMYIYGEFTDYSTFAYPDGYNYKIHISVDLDKAHYWMRRLCNKEWNTIVKDKIETNGLFSRSIEELSSLLHNNGEYNKAIYWCQRQIEYGYRDAYCNLGKMYFEGTGLPKDYQKARHLFEEALLDDEHVGGWYGRLKSDALCYLGIIYRDGLGVNKDLEKAKEFFMKSIDDSLIPAMPYYELAELFFESSKYEEAFKYYRNAVSYINDESTNYNTLAGYKLGLMFIDGIGVEKDIEEGIYYLNEAASRGNNNAIQRLKEMGQPIPKLKLGSSAYW